MRYETVRQALKSATEAGGGMWVTWESPDDGVQHVGRVVDVTATDGGRARARTWPGGEVFSVPTSRLSLAIDPRPAGTGTDDEPSEPSAAGGMTVESMTAALEDRQHPWVTWEDGGQVHRGIVEGWTSEDVGAVLVREDSPASAPLRIMVGRLKLAPTLVPAPEPPSEPIPSWSRRHVLDFVDRGQVVERDVASGWWVRTVRGPAVADDDLASWLTALVREGAIVHDASTGVWRPTRPSDRFPFIAADDAPVNGHGRRWIDPASLDTAIEERDAAVADATRMRRIVWSLVRSLALSESQAVAWMELLLEHEPTG